MQSNKRRRVEGAQSTCRYASLWQHPMFQDVTVQVLLNTRSHTSGTHVPAVHHTSHTSRSHGHSVLARFPAASMVLYTCCEVYRQKCRFTLTAAEVSQGGGGSTGGTGSTADVVVSSPDPQCTVSLPMSTMTDGPPRPHPPRLDIIIDDPCHVPLVHAMLYYMYHEVLPDEQAVQFWPGGSKTPQSVIQLLRLSHEWGVTGCVTQCISDISDHFHVTNPSIYGLDCLPTELKQLIVDVLNAIPAQILEDAVCYDRQDAHTTSWPAERAHTHHLVTTLLDVLNGYIETEVLFLNQHLTPTQAAFIHAFPAAGMTYLLRVQSVMDDDGIEDDETRFEWQNARVVSICNWVHANLGEREEEACKVGVELMTKHVRADRLTSTFVRCLLENAAPAWLKDKRVRDHLWEGLRHQRDITPNTTPYTLEMPMTHDLTWTIPFTTVTDAWSTPDQVLSLVPKTITFNGFFFQLQPEIKPDAVQVCGRWGIPESICGPGNELDHKLSLSQVHLVLLLTCKGCSCQEPSPRGSRYEVNCKKEVCFMYDKPALSFLKPLKVNWRSTRGEDVLQAVTQNCRCKEAAVELKLRVKRCI